MWQTEITYALSIIPLLIFVRGGNQQSKTLEVEGSKNEIASGSTPFLYVIITVLLLLFVILITSL